MLLEQYRLTRDKTKALCAPLTIEDYIPQAVEWASPPKWHLAHVTWFFETFILTRFVRGYICFHPLFNFLFNSYYRGAGERAVRMQRGVFSRPSVDEVYQYRQHVDTQMQVLLSQPISEELAHLIALGINHEQQHQELLLSDLKYVFSLNPIYPVYKQGFELLDEHNTDSGYSKIKGGTYDIGYQKTNKNDFHFDNELGVHKVVLAPYEIANTLVTNGEYLAFIEAGGYANFDYWLEEGWVWREKNNLSTPLYWQKIEGIWYQYTLSGLQVIDKGAILCHISFYEANAYAHWAKMRLPTEFEWEVACEHFSWGERWEWTSSAYMPYSGFSISAGAVGEYNGKFMINQMVLRGASIATASGHSRASYRNFFHPHLQWQYSGIRLVK